MAGRFNFPQWNYGYTLGPAGYGAPPTDYSQYYNYYGQPGAAVPSAPPTVTRGGPRPIPPIVHTTAPPLPPPATKPLEVSFTKTKVEPVIQLQATTPAVIKAGPVLNPVQPAPEVVSKTEPSLAESVIGPVKAVVTSCPGVGPSPGYVRAKVEDEKEKSTLQNILRGRNPVIFCNYQSKMRNLPMEWEQVEYSSLGVSDMLGFENALLLESI